jgi:hypothetical protein
LAQLRWCATLTPRLEYRKNRTIFNLASANGDRIFARLHSCVVQLSATGARRPDDGLATKRLRLEESGGRNWVHPGFIESDISSIVQGSNLTPIVAAAIHILAYLFRIGI